VTKSEIKLRLRLEENGSTARLSILLNGREAAFIIADALELDEILHGLGAGRAEMSDGVPAELDPLPRFRTTETPSWRVFDQEPDRCTLALRHPGFGWLGFCFTRDEAERIASAMMVCHPGRSVAPVSHHSS
jgi:hypothetical protein